MLSPSGRSILLAGAECYTDPPKGGCLGFRPLPRHTPKVRKYNISVTWAKVPKTLGFQRILARTGVRRAMCAKKPNRAVAPRLGSSPALR